MSWKPRRAGYNGAEVYRGTVDGQGKRSSMGRVNPCRQKTGPRAFARGPICFLMELHSLDALDVGLPGAVGAAVRMGHLNAEIHALAAELAFGHID